MIPFILYLLGLLCTNPAPHAPGTQCNGIHVVANTTDGGGETGNPPPPPPPPPPPGG